jgi:uncharacterized protein YbjT (DUF2867 family)
MADVPILVTGAAGGTQGSTGFHVTRLLRERGLPVRAFVHRLDDRSDRLRSLGADVVEGDLLDLRTVTAALAGVSRAYFIYPVQDGLLQAAATFAASARSAGVEQVVNLSQWLQSDGDHPTPHQTRHWLVEQIFDWAQVGAVHLDAAVFYENLRALAQATLAQGVIAVPWGPRTTAIPMVGATDVARVAAAVLTGPALPNGTVLRLMAGSVTNGEIVDAFEGVLGRPVRYVEITDDQWASAACAAGLPDVAVEHLTHLWRYLRTRSPEYQGLYHISDTFERFTGRPPQSLAEFLAEHEDLFAEAAAR